MVHSLSDSYGDAYQYYHHKGSGDFVRNSIFSGYKNIGKAGDVFIDTCGTRYEFSNQDVFARQLNTEANVKDSWP